jgi:peptidoglycan-associated lipoprotein
MRLRNLQILGLVLLLVLTVGVGCKKKAPPPPPPPPPAPAPAPPAPTATISVNPTSIERGQSATVEWSTRDTTEVTITELGTVPASGSRSVRPTQSTTYRLDAKGPGGSTSASARITVTAPPPPPPPEKPKPREPSERELFDQQVRTIYFDYDKYDVRDDQQATLQGNITFFKAHPNVRFIIEGHCDERGSAEYNLGLGDRRANTVKEAMVAAGIAADRIRTISYGKEKPLCMEQDESCWSRNRRGEFKWFE